jgi:hypothetical protein
MTRKFIALRGHTHSISKQNQFMSLNEGLDKKLLHTGIKFPRQSAKGKMPLNITEPLFFSLILETPTCEWLRLGGININR